VWRRRKSFDGIEQIANCLINSILFIFQPLIPITSRVHLDTSSGSLTAEATQLLEIKPEARFVYAEELAAAGVSTDQLAKIGAQTFLTKAKTIPFTLTGSSS
jgi:hypothetical protein